MRIIPLSQKLKRFAAAVRQRTVIVPSVPPAQNLGYTQPVNVANPIRIARLSADAINGKAFPLLVSTSGWMGPTVFSLNTAGTNVPTNMAGRFLWVVDSTAGATASVTFDDSPTAWPLYAGVVIPWPKPGFNQVWLTNAAQPNSTITLASAFDLSLLTALQGLNS